METPQIFISFSGRNSRVRDLVALMWLRFEEQPIDVYNYERPEYGIRPGADIETECKAALDRSKFCLVVVSDESFKSGWANKELEYALSLARKDYVFYIGLTKNLDWPEPFARLLNNKALSLLGDVNDIFTEDVESIVEAVVRQFCSEHGIPYLPPELDLPRLPLRRRIYQEIYSNSENTQSLRSLDIDSILRRCGQFTKSYSAGKLVEAEKKIERITEDIEDLFPFTNAYYPKLIGLVVSLEQVLTLGGDYDALAELDSKAKALAKASDTTIDANVFGLLGNIALSIGDAEGAYTNFEEAQRRLTGPDPAVVHNLALSAILSGDQSRLNGVYSMLEDYSNGSVVTQIGHIKRLQILKAIVGCYNGRAAEGIEQLSQMGNIEPSDFDIFRQFLDQAPEHAKRINDREASVRILDLISRTVPLASEISNHHEVSLLQREAFLALELGLNKRALMAIEKAVSNSDYCKSVPLLTHAALVTHACGANKLAKNYANLAMGETRFTSQPDSTSHDEFEYHRGLAAWLLEKDDIANDCFSRVGDNPQFIWDARDYAWVSRRKLNRLGWF